MVIVREVLGWWRGSASDQRTFDRQSRQDTRDEFQNLYTHLLRELDKANSKIDALEKREERCQHELTKLWRVYERLKERNDHFENELRNANIPFRPWTEVGTNEHPPLKEVA